MNKSRFPAWLKLIFTTVLLPLLIFWAGTFYLASLNREMRFRAFATEADETLAAMRTVAETEKYLCSGLRTIFDGCNDAGELKSAVEKFAHEHELEMRYLIWQPSGDIFFANFAYQSSAGDWSKAFLQMKEVARNTYNNLETNIPAAVLENLRQVFGPHFFPLFYGICFSGRDLCLLRPDATLNFPLTWLNVNDRFGLTVLFDYNVLTALPGLKKMVKNASGDLQIGFFSRNAISCRNQDLVNDLKPRQNALRQSFGNQQNLPGYYIFTNFFDENLTGFCAVERSSIDGVSAGRLMMVALLLLHLCFAVYAILSYRVVVLQVKLSLGIRKQLLLLFVVANILPGFLLMVSGFDYLQQFRAGLFNLTYNQSLAYLQNIDELFRNEYTIQKERLTQSFKELREALRKNQLNRLTIENFLEKQSPAPDMLFLVASSTGMVAGKGGIIKDGKLIDEFDTSLKTNSVRINIMNAIFKLGSYVMAIINKVPVSSKTGTEVEFIAESLMQKKPVEMVRMFYERGTFWQWGIGQAKHPIFVDNFSLFSPELIDYVMLYVWDARVLEIGFLKRIFLDLTRNEAGIKVMAVNDVMTRAFPEEILGNRLLMDFALKLRDRTLTRPEFCTIDGNDYLLAGFKCILMPTIRLFALFPARQIEQEVTSRGYLMLLLLLLSLLVSISLGLSVAAGVLNPLSILQVGIEELQKRNFAYRLPDLGRNEFGALAHIFNDILVDLEEMQVAAIVQEKLMTRMENSLQIGCLKFFGRTVAPGDSGSDYFEVFDTFEKIPALLLGSVSGQGVGKCLLLAFVKSAAIQIREMSAQPLEFMNGLNSMIHLSKSVDHGMSISLQYVLPSADGKIEIVNTGLQNPILIDHVTCRALLPCGSATSSAAGPEVGVTRFSVELARGQSLICFSNGITGSGKIDMQQINDLLLQTRSDDPREFVGRFLDKYAETARSNNCTDDVSIAIFCNKHES